MKRISTIAGVIIITVAAVVLFGGVLCYQYFASKNNLGADQIAGWKTYKNTKYGFEIKYPQDWVLNFNKYNYCHTDFCLNIGSNKSVRPPVVFISGPFGGPITDKTLYPQKGETISITTINNHPASLDKIYLPYYYSFDYIIQDTNINENWDIGTSDSRDSNESVKDYNNRVNYQGNFLKQIVSTFKFTK